MNGLDSLPMDMDVDKQVEQQEATRREQAATPAVAARRRRPATDRILDVVLPLLSLAVVLALWQILVVAFGVKSFVFPRLDDTLGSLGAHWGDIWPNLLTTLFEAGTGFVIGNALAVLGATLFVYSRPVERTLFPVAVIVQTIPIIVWAPILVIALPTGSGPQIVVAVLISFFPALVNMTRGLRAVDPLVLELFHVINASRWQVYRMLRWPSSIPALFSSLRITSTLSLIGAIVGEYAAGGGQGVGYELIVAKNNIDTAQVMAITLVVSVAGIVVFLAVAGIERAVLAARGQSS